MERVYLEPSMVPASIRGNYSGKQFKAIVCTEMTIPADAGLWSGGSRETYRVIRLEDGKTIEPVNHHAAPWDNSRKSQAVKLEPGIAVVEHTMFCGKDLGLTFYVHPENAAKLLPAPVELSQAEKLVLTYTATRKSSYNGRDRYGYGENRGKLILSRADWDAAKQSLIGRGFLNKAGAITVSGRNAARA